MVNGSYSYPMSLSIFVIRKRHFVFSSDRHGLEVKHIDSERDRQIDSCGVSFIILLASCDSEENLAKEPHLQEWECAGYATRACEGFR